jgi:hypothetical protein
MTTPGMPKQLHAIDSLGQRADPTIAAVLFKKAEAGPHVVSGVSQNFSLILLTERDLIYQN